MTVPLRLQRTAQCVLALAIFAITNITPAYAQSSFPGTVKPTAVGVEVLTYTGSDGQLKRGDIISWVATPDARNEEVSVTTSAGLDKEFTDKRTKDGSIALWVTRGNAPPDWVFLKLTATPAPGLLPLTVRQANGGVEVVTYSGKDGMLSKGDLISWVATPGVSNAVAVDSPAKFETEVTSTKGPDGITALWVSRGNAAADWVLVDLATISNGPNSGTGGPLMVPPPSKTAPGSLGTQKPSPGSADDASALHVLYIYDPKAQNDSFRWGCEFDVYRMDAYLSNSIPSGVGVGSHTFATPAQDAAGLLEAIRDYKNKISTNDTLLIYYSGHGSNDDKIGQILDIRPGVKVARSEVRQAMQDTGARLCVLITDCCASGSKTPFPGSASAATPLDYTSPYWNASICRALFLRHTGFVDVTSAGPGEAAWSVGPTDANNSFSGKEPTDGEIFDDGGLFTTSLLEILAMHDGELKKENMMDRQGRITWESIKQNLAERTERRFQETIYPSFRRQRDKDRNKHQAVTFLSTGQPVGNALPVTSQSKLGIEFNGGPSGVVAGNVDANRTPAVGIKPGDRLVSVRRLTDSYDAHFWQDRKFTGGSQLGNTPTVITGLANFQKLNTPQSIPGGGVASPFLSSGMWVFSVERNGVPTEVIVRITEPSVFAR